ncbi:hypothetical protein CEXT_305681 [Caerostris extrusa]|uniref:Uncharacterized protein n=1 Tax=Caerostris extrusa TaxID=172846 RepID=A0AAV4V245_CAEEX|nr:hypothetical protein CEXT_305681 [Caerostris extrusa]
MEEFPRKITFIQKLRRPSVPESYQGTIFMTGTENRNMPSPEFKNGSSFLWRGEIVFPETLKRKFVRTRCSKGPHSGHCFSFLGRKKTHEFLGMNAKVKMDVFG